MPRSLVGWTVAFTAILLASPDLAWPNNPTMRELFPAAALGFPGIEQELGRDVYGRTWDLSAGDRANFTFASGIAGQMKATSEKTLRFVAGAEDVILGWGNYDGKQPLDERLHLWPWSNTVKLKVRQSGSRSVWRCAFWADGHQPGRAKSGKGWEDSVERVLEGADWQVLAFPSAEGNFHSQAGIVPDAMGFAIETEPDNTFEIASLEITRRLHEGCVRKEFQLPEGPIWRAVAEVGIMSRLYVNGRQVPIDNAVFRRPSPEGPAAGRFTRGPYAATIPVDLTGHFKPGLNCVGMATRQVDRCDALFFQGRVVMQSGEVIDIESDADWQYSHQASEGWSEPGFAAKEWRSVEIADWQQPNRFGLYSLHNSLLVSGYLIGQGGNWVGPAVPVYGGRLVLENPNDSMLYYDVSRPVVVRVKCPRGLAERSPVLRWKLLRSDEEGETTIAEGVVDCFSQADRSMTCHIDCGRLERGVYALDLIMKAADGTLLEDRIREPLLVIGRLPMQEVEGRHFAEGMTLHLEDTIDFTDPNDPHSWIETEGGLKDRSVPTPARLESNIVRRQGLVYRETAPLDRHQASSGAPFFSYRFAFQNPHAFYMMELEYPDDAERWIGVQVSTTIPNVHNNAKAGPSVWTGDKYPLSRRMRQLRWIQRAGPGMHTLDVIPLQRGSTAAAARVRMFRMDALPALKCNPLETGNRHFGVYTERTAAHRGFWQTFGPTRPVSNVMPLSSPPAEFRPMDERLRYLRDALDSCQRFTQYLRFTGQNLHAMGCFQYSDNNTPYTPPESLFGSRVPRDLREMAIRVFGRNGIDVLAVVEYNGHSSLSWEYPLNDGQVAAGEDCAVMVSDEGRQPSARSAGRGYGSGWNPLHPAVSQKMLDVAENVARKFHCHDNFLGVHWTVYLTGEWGPGFGGMGWSTPLKYSYDDATIAQFEAESGLDVPGGTVDPARFAQRAEFLCTPAMRDKWIDWRCQKLHRFFRGMRDRLAHVRDDLDLILGLYVDNRHAIDWSAHEEPVDQYLRAWGYDLRLYQDEPHLRVSRWMNATLHSDPALRRPGYAAGWEQFTGPQFLTLYEDFKRPAVTIMHQWFEINLRAPHAVFDGSYWKFAQPSEWPNPGNRGRLLVQPAGDNARETFALALAGTDPQTLAYGFLDVNMMVGQEQELREFARVFRALPAEKFRPALGTDLRTNLVIRELCCDDGHYVVVANPGCWLIRGRVTFVGAERVIDLAAGTSLVLRCVDGKEVLPITLDPYGVTAFRAAGSGVKLVAWENDPVDSAELAHLLGIMDRAKQAVREANDGGPSDAETEFIRQTLQTAEEALAAGRYATAWHLLTHHRFWTWLKEHAPG